MERESPGWPPGTLDLIVGLLDSRFHLGVPGGLDHRWNERKGKGCDSLIRLEGAAQTISTSGEVFHFQ